jgi:Protein of unknown function (DUF2726)
MSWLFLLVLVIVILIALAAFLKGAKTGAGSDGFPYQRNKALFSPAERSFLGALEQAVGGEYRVFGKVRIADVASVRSNPNRAFWQRAFNRISAKHFDFILCKPDDLSIVCAVELDDKSHQQMKRKDRDDFVAGLCIAIDLPLLQIPAQRAYSVPELRSRVSLAISPPPPVSAVNSRADPK